MKKWLLECPHYTKPMVHDRWHVPDVLVSGHHQQIKDWKFLHSLRYTLYKRPDLVAEKRLNEHEQTVLKQLVHSQEAEYDQPY